MAQLPEVLDRQTVRAACANSTNSAPDAMRAFLATMAWGYGRVGYGVWRVAQAFTDLRVGRKLLDVARTLDQEGPQAAYQQMGGESRLPLIGPAFGTKFLYFCDSGRFGRRGLILDRLVAVWLRENTHFWVNSVPWSPNRYGAYLNQMREWAANLAVEPDALELVIFLEMSERRGNQWTPNSPEETAR
jgi:hypothetical protein